jgi:hypothetical protein
LVKTENHLLRPLAIFSNGFRVLLTLGPSTGIGLVLIRLEASNGGFTDCGVVVGGGCVVIGKSPPS